MCDQVALDVVRRRRHRATNYNPVRATNKRHGGAIHPNNRHVWPQHAASCQYGQVLLDRGGNDGNLCQEPSTIAQDQAQDCIRDCLQVQAKCAAHAREHLFGCRTHILTLKKKRLRWNPKVCVGLVLVYEKLPKSYQMYVIVADDVITRRDVSFDESTSRYFVHDFR